MANLLTRFDPFTDLATYAPLREIDELWRDLRRRVPGDGEGGMRLDVNETDKAYTVRADIPGAKKEDIKVDVDGNRVAITAELHKETEEKDGKTVRSERYEGHRYRSFTLEHAVDDAAAVAKYEDGVLRLTLPKKAPQSGRKLQIS